MANFQLEDLLRDDRKDANLLPDLSKATCNSEAEFKPIYECSPDFKIKPDKVRKDDVKVRDSIKEFSWRTTRKELRAISREWSYGDPVPPDMRVLNLQELQQVPIDWRMLTPLRPKLRQDEEMFSRLVTKRAAGGWRLASGERDCKREIERRAQVEMGKLQLKTRARERRSFVSPIRRAKNRAGIIQSSVRICGDCGEEFCGGESCGDVLYDAFIRVTVSPHPAAKARSTADAAAIIAGMSAGPGQSGKKKRKHAPGVPRAAAGKRKGSKTPRLLVRKGKAGKPARKGSKLSADQVQGNAGTGAHGTRKFRHKCTKYRGRKRNTD
ncbi:uncharacterized protein LOC131675700 isoform X1 [Phymastichus coffea]|uniref:uncharacterized protein LOC131675700 isoform X1 n=1 Tax=Phymastichus coffea TaxID=108790 RepID=UPI00273CA5FB|nr:uncharacterized protein LOC131675700 isoform X1 [Phymastichus coffea]